MRKDTTFTDRLSREEFSEKYWMGGLAPYLYHVVDIEDGRDEREQLLINNIRALKEAIEFYAKYAQETRKRINRTVSDAIS